MTIAAVQPKTDFFSVLSSPGRSHEIHESEDLYGQFVGSWELEVFDHLADGTVRQSAGEAHFAWVLEGRAVQDLWIMPRVSQRSPDLARAGNRFGTTLRVWDPAIRAWRVTWINPVSGMRNELVGRRVGNDLVQIGQHPDGRPIRWCFTDITRDSFRWTGEALQDDGTTWKLEAEFHARRIAS